MSNVNITSTQNIYSASRRLFLLDEFTVNRYKVVLTSTNSVVLHYEDLGGGGGASLQNV